MIKKLFDLGLKFDWGWTVENTQKLIRSVWQQAMALALSGLLAQIPELAKHLDTFTGVLLYSAVLLAVHGLRLLVTDTKEPPKTN